MARVVGLRSGSAAQISHHCSAHQLNGSRPRWSPCQAPRVTPSRFLATRSRASSLLLTVSAPWEPSSSSHHT